MEISAIYHSPDKGFCYALNKGIFLFRLRTKKDDMYRVVLHTTDKYIPIERSDTRKNYRMKKVATDGACDYYEAVIEMDVICLRYFFELEDTNGEVLYYSNFQFMKELVTDKDDMFDCPQNLREEERFCVPEWAKNKVVYQIFPKSFATTQDVPERVWYRSPIKRYPDMKGNLQGIIDKLSHIQELGADIIYLNPVFAASSYHKYDTVDYYKIDPEFGTEEDLRRLVEKAHELGLRVILDAVFNHTSRDFFAFQDVLENGEASAYCNWYYIDSFPLKAKLWKRPTYQAFAYYGGMPKLNLQNPEVENYILDVVRYWMRSCRIDGWRLDVGDEISHSFWKKFRTVVKNENPEALIVGETWRYTGDFLEGDEWDSIMNYDFRKAALGFAAWGTLTPSQFVQRIGFLRGNAHINVYPVLWNLLDSHDTERALYCCEENKDKFKLAVALQLLSTGSPMLYYGDEYGLSGGPDPDCRRGMLWKEKLQDKDIYAWYQTLLRLRKEYPVLTEGNITEVYTDDDKGILAITKELPGDNVENNTSVLSTPFGGDSFAGGSEKCKGIKVTTVFYNGKNPVVCENSFGCKNPKGENEFLQGEDLVTGQVFNGTLRPYQTSVIKWQTQNE